MSQEPRNTLERRWEISEPLETCRVVTEDGSTIIVRRHGNPGGPRLILSHGNGLSIDLYYPFWSLLEERFDVIVYDLRNHGWNPVSSQERHKIPEFVSDNERVFEAVDLNFGSKPKIGVFHSISGLAALLQAAKSDAFAALVLFDPPLCAPGRSQQVLEEQSVLLAQATRRRAERFPAREVYTEILDYSPGYVRVVPGVLELISRTTLRPCSNGSGFELRCPREYEAQAVDYVSAWAVLVNFEEIRCPVKVLGGDPTLPYSYLPTFDLSEMVNVNYDFVPDTTHYLQLERPDKCLQVMVDFLQVHGLLGQ